MEKIRQDSLKRTFTAAVAVTMLSVFLLSAITVYGCYHIQKYILPDSGEVWLHMQKILPDGTVSESRQRFILDLPSAITYLAPSDAENPPVFTDAQFTIEKIESSFSALSPKKQILYRAMTVSIVALPFLYAVTGIGLCAWWFYRKKLSPPIRVLTDAADHISSQDLDFTVNSSSQDELGQLCMAFEKMRQALYDNNRQMWNMIEERRTLQASVAHDLRNPIAIIEGYVEYMQQSLINGNLGRDKLERTLSNLAVSTKRLERYTDYIRDLHAIDETQINYSPVQLPALLDDMLDGFQVMAGPHGCKVSYHTTISQCKAALDEHILYRILENIFSNALRYAESSIFIEASLEGGILSIRITDDGKGFSKKILGRENTLFYSEDTTGQHLGLGLAVSRILSQKHGGNIELSNRFPKGACVRVKISISDAVSN